MSDSKVYDLIGNEADGKVEITLRPGFGVQVDNEHLEGGPHQIPVNIAVQLVTCGKAFTPTEAAAYHEGVARAEAEAAAEADAGIQLALGDDDLPVFFGDFGVDITYNGETVKGLLDNYDARESGYGIEMVDRLKIVTIQSDAFSTPLVREAAVTVNGVASVIRDIVQKNDGGITAFSVVLP